MFSGKDGRSTLMLCCCVLIGLGSVTQIQSFGQIFGRISLPQGKSLGELARKKIADLHSMRSQLEHKRLNHIFKSSSPTAETNTNENETVDKVESNIKHENPTLPTLNGLSVNLNKSGNETIFTDKWTNNSNYSTDTKNNKMATMSPIQERISLFPTMWDSLRSVISIKKSRDGFLSRILPNSQVLLKLIKMRNEMDPNLRDYLTSKYNNWLTKLIPYSDGIGIPSFVLNSMKISKSQDLHWYYLEKLLETTSVTDLIQSIPDFSSSSSLLLSTFNNNNPTDVDFVSNSLPYEPIQSRVDDELVSDQEPKRTEPDVTIKGHKKKYTNSNGINEIRLGNRRNHRPTKGDLAEAASSSATNLVGPDRTGYDYSSYADQYGLYGHDSYDTYGKGHDDYSASHKGYGHGGGSGHSGGGHGGHKGGGYGGTGKGHGGSSFSYGHSTYYTPKSYGGSGGGYGHSSYGYSSGGGHGGGGYGMNGFLDPFSILGTLAFLTYLGLLFQRSMTPTMMMNGTGRAFPNDRDPIFESQTAEERKPIELTILNFGKDNPEKILKKHYREIRSLDNLSEDYMSPEILEDTWREIDTITHINELNCRQLKLCFLVQDIGQTSLLSIFKEALEKWEVDRKFLKKLYNQTDTKDGITCGYSELSLDCNKIIS